MLAFLPASRLIVACVALVPGGLTWWVGRTLRTAGDDPLIAERLWALRSRGRSLLAICWALLLVGWPGDFAWAFPIMILARGIAAYPLRRAIHGESWRLPTYLWFYARLIVAVFGFWMLALSASAISGLARAPYDWAVAILIAAVLVVWNSRQAAFLRAVLGVRPIDDPELVARFTALVARAGLRMPRFEVVDMRGGVLANAVALPSLSEPGVLMTSTLLERFDRDEVTAICGHELAHLEQYHARRLRRLNVGNYALVAGSVLIGPLISRIGRSFSWPILGAWGVTVLVALAVRARSRQKDETASDLRAVEWTGDPEAMVRALTKLHTIGRVPRRWEARFERNATHPSLSRRIQAIRTAAGQTAPPLASPRSFTSGPSTLTFHDDRLQWNESELVAHTFAYQQLSELRLDVRKTSAPRLLAVERSGRRWEIAFGAADVGGIQTALDAIDTRLGAAASPPSMPLVPVRVLCAIATAFALMAGQIAVVVPSLLASLRPTVPLLTAAAAGMLTVAAIGNRGGWMVVLEEQMAWLPLALAAIGLLLAVMAWMTRKDDQPSVLRPMLVLALCAVLASIVVLVSGGTAVRLHQASRDSPGAAALAIALAAGLLATKKTEARAASILPALVGLALVVAGSRPFLDRYGSDPFLGLARPIAVRTIADRPTATVPLPVTPTEIRLSPGGRSVVFGSMDITARRTVFHIGRVAGPFTTLQGDHAFFADDDRALLVQASTTGVTLRVVAVDDPTTTIWSHRVADVVAPRVWVKPAGIWRLLARSRTDRAFVAVEGRIGSDEATVRRWPTNDASTGDDDDEETSVADAIGSAADRLLMVRTRYAGLDRFSSRWTALAATLVDPLRSETDVWVVDQRQSTAIGTSQFDVQCAGAAGTHDEPMCAAFDGRSTTIFTIDLATTARTAIGKLPGRLTVMHDSGSGWLTGWSMRGAVAVRADASDAVRVATPKGASYVRAIAATDRAVAAVVGRGVQSVLLIYAR